MLKFLIVGLAGIIAVMAQPASAQYSYPESRSGRVSDKIARTIDEAARAVGTVTDAYDRSVYELRYRGAERYAIDACRPQVERYGRMRIDDVRPYKRSSFRVYGVTEGYRGNYVDRYRSSSFGPRSFTCTVSDRRKIKVKTKRLRDY